MKTQKKNLLKIAAMCAIILSCVAFSLFNNTVSAQETAREKVAFPSLEQSCVYDGTEKSPTYDARYCRPNQNVKYTIAGDYFVKFNLTDKTRYCWEDGSDGEVTVKFTIEKAVFDRDSLIFRDQTFVYDGQEHYLEVIGLPSFAKVLFKTLASKPGVYDSVVQIDLGSNYVNDKIELTGAKMTILATTVEGEDYSFTDERGFSHELVMSSDVERAKAFEKKLPRVGTVFVARAPKATLKGAQYDFGTGKFKYKLTVPTRYIGVKAFVNDDGVAKEVKITWEGQQATFEADSLCEFAVVYTGVVQDPPQFLWLEILLGVVIAVEACFIVVFALKLKKFGKTAK